MDFNQIGNGVPGNQGIISPVVPLAHAVAHIGGKVQGGFGSGPVRGFGGFLGKLKQMGAARGGSAHRCFNQHLGLFQILGGPAHAHTERVHLRGQPSSCLAF